MSIINKMHQDFDHFQHAHPILGDMPTPKNKFKPLIFIVVFLLLLSSLWLVYLIFTESTVTLQTDVSVQKETIISGDVGTNAQLKTLDMQVEKTQLSVVSATVTEPSINGDNTRQINTAVESEQFDNNKPFQDATIETSNSAELVVDDPGSLEKEALASAVVKNNNSVKTKIAETPKATTIAETPKAATIAEIPKAAKIAETPKAATIAEIPKAATIAKTPKREKALPIAITDLPEPISVVNRVVAKPIKAVRKNENYLKIQSVKLSNEQLANIHLQDAKKAEAKGDLELAVEKRNKALGLLPTLNEVRKSLVLYYYGLGDVAEANRLLKIGVLASPEYSDFNLMLSRIALKGGDYQKAYFYLEQHPPIIDGHLDYYVSYAILAQKFKKFPQAEHLYLRLLSQRPYNGRWRMSLAIAQDKQGKIERALSSYNTALLQPDLSLQAKAYIKQRLIYLQ